jgi:hypothetical protein
MVVAESGWGGDVDVRVVSVDVDRRDVGLEGSQFANEPVSYFFDKRRRLLFVLSLSVVVTVVTRVVVVSFISFI